MPVAPSAQPSADEPLRIAWLVYRGNPHCGGQGVYTRYVAREVAALGHHIEVLSGQPWPRARRPRPARRGAGPRPVPPPDPFRVPHVREFKDSVDVREFGIMCVAGFPEPWAFSERARRILQGPSRRLRPRPRQPVPRLGRARDDEGRLAGHRDDPPPDHRRSRARHRARGSASAAGSRCAAGTGSCGCSCASHRASLASSPSRSRSTRHRRADGRARRADDRGPHRRRREPLPSAAGRRPRAGTAHDDGERRRAAQGADHPARGAGEGAGGASRRPPCRHRPPEGRTAPCPR